VRDVGFARGNARLDADGATYGRNCGQWFPRAKDGKGGHSLCHP
jgi:hypothetical protein